MADKASTLTDSVPKIIITEPSPMPTTINSGLIKKIIGDSSDSEVISVTAEPMVVTSKADLLPEANFPATTAEENVTSDSDASCSVSVEDNKVQEVTLEVAEEEGGGDLLTPPADEVAEGGLMEVAEGAYASCCRRFDNFSESRFMIAIFSVLITMPIGAVLMGARYQDKCPLSNETPIFLFMMGVLGILVIPCRVMMIVRKTPPNSLCFHLDNMLQKIIVFGCLAILLLLCTEMMSFLHISPNFEPGAPNYCHRHFYNFTYWFNWTSLFVIPFLVVLHVPKCRRQNVSQTQS